MPAHGPARRPVVACLTGVGLILGLSVAGVGLALSATPASEHASTRLVAATVPEEPRLLFHEDFEGAPGQWQGITDHVGPDGIGYTASPYWSSAALCNGLVTVHTPSPVPASPCGLHPDASLASELVPRAYGAPASATNHALAWYSADPTVALPMAPGDAVLRTVGGIAIPSGGRFLRVAFDGAGLQCPNPAPSLVLTVDDGATEHSPWAGQVELCTDARSSDVGAAPFGRVRVGRYLSESAVRVSSDRVDLVLRNGDNGSPGHFNDGGVDELRLLDITPALDVVFDATGPVTTGTATTLTFTVTNTTELLAKEGWAFHDQLPAPLTVAGPTTTSCTGAAVTAPEGGASIELTGGVLAQGATSCSVQVPVSAATAGTYDAGTMTRVALEPPGPTTVTFVAPAPTTPTSPTTPGSPGTPTTSGGAAGPVHAGGSPGTSVPSPGTGGSPMLPSADSSDGPADNPSLIPSADTSDEPSDLPSDEPSEDPSGSPAAAPAGPAEPGGRLGSHDAPYDPDYDVDRTRPDAPSALTDELPSITEVLRHPSLIGGALAAGLVWTLGLVVTTGTLNRALKTRYDRLAQLGRRLTSHALLARIAAGLASGHLAVVVVLLAVNATVLAFVDPNIGLDAASVRLVVSIATAQLICGAVPFWVAAAVSRRRWQVPARIRTLPIGLVFATVGVGISRLIGFVPGLLAGAMLGLSAPDATPEHNARLERLEALVTFGIAAIAWPLTSLIPTDQGWQLVFAHDTAVAVTISAILGTLIDLLPFAAFPGGVMKAHLPASWAALTVVTWAAFVVFVVPQTRYWINVGDGVTRWITIALVAMVAGIAVALLLHRRDVRRTAAVTGS